MTRFLPTIGFLLVAGTLGAQPVPTAPLGAMPTAGGVTFRVWAPHATTVEVRGTFNSWGSDLPLFSEGANGVWSRLVPSAHAGDPYKYYLTNPAAIPPRPTFAWRRDPYQRDIDAFSASDSNSRVYDPNAFDWGGAPAFTVAPLRDLVMY